MLLALRVLEFPEPPIARVAVERPPSGRVTCQARQALGDQPLYASRNVVRPDRRAVDGPRAEQVAFVRAEVGVHPEGGLGASPLTSLVLLRCGRTFGAPDHNTSAAASAATGVSERPLRTTRHRRRAAAHPPPTRPAAHAPLASPVPGAGPQPPHPDRHQTLTPRAWNTPPGGAATDSAGHPAHAHQRHDHAPPTPSWSVTARGVNDPAYPRDSLTKRGSAARRPHQRSA